MKPASRRRWAWTLKITAALLTVAWVWSMRFGVAVEWPPRYTLAVGSGQIMFARDDKARPSKGPSFELSRDQGWGVEWWFGWERFGILGPPTITVWHAPLWPFILMAGVPGVWKLVRTRKPTNACPACGYDTTGLPTNNGQPAPCPECGPHTRSQSAKP